MANGPTSGGLQRGLVRGAGLWLLALSLPVFWACLWPDTIPRALCAHAASLPLSGALCFLTAGLCLALWRRAWLLYAGGLAVLSVGGLTLVEYIIRMEVGLGARDASHQLLPFELMPGHLPVLSAIGFLLLGALLLALPQCPRHPHGRLSVRLWAGMILTLCLVSLFAALPLGWNVNPGYLGVMTGGARAGFLVVAAIFLFVNTRAPGREYAQSLRLSLITGAGIFLGSVVLWTGLIALEQAHLSRMVRAQAFLARYELTTEIRYRCLVLENLAQHWGRHGGPTFEEWSADARQMLRHYPAGRSLEWVDRSLRVRWMAAPAAASAEQDRELVLPEAARRRLDLARENARGHVRVFDEGPGRGHHLEMMFPLWRQDRFDGYLRAVFSVSELVHAILPPSSLSGFNLSLSDDQTVLYRSPGTEAAGDLFWEQELNLDVEGVFLRVVLWPDPSLAAGLLSPLPGVGLLSGVVVSWLFAMMVLFAQLVRRRAEQAESVSLELRREILRRQEMESALRRAQEGLEHRVHDRTRELEAANASLEQENEVRRRAEQALREKQREVVTLMKNLPGMVYRCRNDELRTMQFASEGCLELTEYPPAELELNRAVAYGQLIHAQDREESWEAIQRAVASQSAYHLQYRLLTAAGKLRWVWDNGIGVYDDQNRLICLEGIITDITDRKQAEETSEAAARELERSNRELEQFAYVASHDLQEPLRMVTGYVELLNRRYENQLDEEARTFISYAVEGAAHMQRLIEDLLAYSRVGRHGKTFSSVELDAVLEQTLANLEPRIAESGAAVTIAGPLPSVWGDATQLVQLFQNLIANAIKFRAAEPLRIRVDALQETGEWVFSVRDNGIGIDPKYHDRIFVIFQRLHTRRQYNGTGIGLAICKRVIERHGGRIWVESLPEQGSAFRFTLNSRKDSRHGQERRDINPHLVGGR